MKKYFLLAAFILGALILVFAGLFLRRRATGENITNPSRADLESSVLPLEERPYVVLIPRSDGHELKLQIENLKGVQSIDYELVYFVDDVSRGVIGSVNVQGESSFSRDLLLGSCSRNVCKYDEGVKNGMLTLSFRGAAGVQKYEASFYLQKGKEAKNVLSSQDENFSFQGILSGSAFYLTMGTVGLPEKIEGKVVGGPYGIFTTSSLSAKGILKLKLQEAPEKIKIFGWDGTAWKEYSRGLRIEDNSVFVEVDRLTTFIAVSS